MISSLFIYLSTFIIFAVDIPIPTKSIDTEIKAVAEDISKNVRPDQAPFIKYFTSYNLPDDINENSEALLSFTVNSLSAGPVIVKPVKLTNTLFKIDIRDYRWTTTVFEQTYKVEPYIQYPWIDTANVGKNYEFIRNVSGNSLLRLDWFIINGLDQTRQLDRGFEFRIYPELLYASRQGGVPKNVQEVRDFWIVDRKTIDSVALAKGAVVDTGESAVSRFNRVLYFARTPVGYWTETYDSDEEDYVENLQAENSIRKASEFIGSTFTGLQFYGLANSLDGDKLIDFGDPTFVRDRLDPSDIRVRTAWSCIRCHQDGLNRPDNKIKNILLKNVNLNAIKDYDVALRLKRFYLSELNGFLKESNNMYADAIFQCNGLTPEENLNKLQSLYNFYDKPIDLLQACRETGVSSKELIARSSNTTSGRLAYLVQGGNVSRYEWEGRKNVVGVFGKAMLHIYNLVETQPLTNQIPPVKIDYQGLEYVTVNSDDAVLLRKTKNHEAVIIPIDNGTQLKVYRNFNHVYWKFINEGSRASVVVEYNNLPYIINTKHLK